MNTVIVDGPAYRTNQPYTSPPSKKTTAEYIKEALKDTVGFPTSVRLKEVFNLMRDADDIHMDGPCSDCFDVIVEAFKPAVWE